MDGHTQHDIPYFFFLAFAVSPGLIIYVYLRFRSVAVFFSSHEVGFWMSTDCNPEAMHMALVLTPRLPSHVRKCAQYNVTPITFRGHGSCFTAASIWISGERTAIYMLLGHIPPCPRS
jgi:hypothetical protein